MDVSEEIDEESPCLVVPDSQASEKVFEKHQEALNKIVLKDKYDSPDSLMPDSLSSEAHTTSSSLPSSKEESSSSEKEAALKPKEYPLFLTRSEREKKAGLFRTSTPVDGSTIAVQQKLISNIAHQTHLEHTTPAKISPLQESSEQQEVIVLARNTSSSDDLISPPCSVKVDLDSSSDKIEKLARQTNSDVVRVSASESTDEQVEWPAVDDTGSISNLPRWQQHMCRSPAHESPHATALSRTTSNASTVSSRGTSTQELSLHQWQSPGNESDDMFEVESVDSPSNLQDLSHLQQPLASKGLPSPEFSKNICLEKSNGEKVSAILTQRHDDAVADRLEASPTSNNDLILSTQEDAFSLHLTQSQSSPVASQVSVEAHKESPLMSMYKEQKKRSMDEDTMTGTSLGVRQDVSVLLPMPIGHPSTTGHDHHDIDADGISRNLLSTDSRNVTRISKTSPSSSGTSTSMVSREKSSSESNDTPDEMSAKTCDLKNRLKTTMPEISTGPDEMVKRLESNENPKDIKLTESSEGDNLVLLESLEDKLLKTSKEKSLESTDKLKGKLTKNSKVHNLFSQIFEDDVIQVSQGKSSESSDERKVIRVSGKNILATDEEPRPSSAGSSQENNSKLNKQPKPDILDESLNLKNRLQSSESLLDKLVISTSKGNDVVQSESCKAGLTKAVPNNDLKSSERLKGNSAETSEKDSSICDQNSKGLSESSDHDNLISSKSIKDKLAASGLALGQFSGNSESSKIRKRDADCLPNRKSSLRTAESKLSESAESTESGLVGFHFSPPAILLKPVPISTTPACLEMSSENVMQDSEENGGNSTERCATSRDSLATVSEAEPSISMLSLSEPAPNEENTDDECSELEFTLQKEVLSPDIGKKATIPTPCVRSVFTNIRERYQPAKAKLPSADEDGDNEFDLFAFQVEDYASRSGKRKRKQNEECDKQETKRPGTKKGNTQVADVAETTTLELYSKESPVQDTKRFWKIVETTKITTRTTVVETKTKITYAAQNGDVITTKTMHEFSVPTYETTTTSNDESREQVNEIPPESPGKEIVKTRYLGATDTSTTSRDLSKEKSTIECNISSNTQERDDLSVHAEKSVDEISPLLFPSSTTSDCSNHNTTAKKIAGENSISPTRKQTSDDTQCAHKRSRSCRASRRCINSPRVSHNDTRVLRENTRVLALWCDKYYYPGRVLSKSRSDSRYRIRFDDGGQTDIQGQCIIPIDYLPRDQAVMFCEKTGGDYVNGVIAGYYQNGNEWGYKVVREDNKRKRCPRGDVILSAEQAAIFLSLRDCQMAKEDSPLKTSENDSALNGEGRLLSTVENIMESSPAKRLRRSCEKDASLSRKFPQEDTKKSRICTEKCTSNSRRCTDDSRSKSRRPFKKYTKKLRSTNKANSNQRQFADAKTNVECKVAKNNSKKGKRFRKILRRKARNGKGQSVKELPERQPNSDASETPKSSHKSTGKKAKSAGKAVDNSGGSSPVSRVRRRLSTALNGSIDRTNIIPVRSSPRKHCSRGSEAVDTAIIPTNKDLFRGYGFLLTGSDVTCECADDSSPQEEEHVFFIRKQVSRQIEAGGGVVLKQFPRDDRGKGLWLLLSNACQTTAKYFHALVLGVPCVSHAWVRDCCLEGKLISVANYMLPAGRNLITEALVERQNYGDALRGLKVHLVGDKDFKEQWCEVLRAAGCEIISKLPANVLQKLQHDEDDFLCDVIVVGSGHVAYSTIQKARLLNIATVNVHWVKQCILMGERVDYYAHNSFIYRI